MTSRIRADLILAKQLEVDSETQAPLTKHIVRSARPDIRTAVYEHVWTRREKVGAGGFSHGVHLEECIHGQKKGQLRAVKEIYRRSDEDLEAELEPIAFFSQERYRHCFPEFYGWWTTGNVAFLAMEFFALGDLNNCVKSALPEPDAKSIIAQILEGLSFMHDHRFVHRDIKPGNILVLQREPTWAVKIADFGVSVRGQRVDQSFHDPTGTKEFAAPEVFGFSSESCTDASISYTDKVDLWSVGVLTVFILTLRYSFPNLMVLSSYSRCELKLRELSGWKQLSTGARHFVRDLIELDPVDRPTATEALLQPWLAQHSENTITNLQRGVDDLNLVTQTPPHSSSPGPSGAWTMRGSGAQPPNVDRSRRDRNSSHDAMITGPIGQEKGALTDTHVHSASEVVGDWDQLGEPGLGDIKARLQNELKLWSKRIQCLPPESGPNPFDKGKRVELAERHRLTPQTRFERLLIRGEVDHALEAFKGGRMDPDSRSNHSDGQPNALHYACMFGDTAVVETLLEAQWSALCPATCYTDSGVERWPPIAWAIFYLHPDVVRRLLDVPKVSIHDIKIEIQHGSESFVAKPCAGPHILHRGPRFEKSSIVLRDKESHIKAYLGILAIFLHRVQHNFAYTTDLLQMEVQDFFLPCNQAAICFLVDQGADPSREGLSLIAYILLGPRMLPKEIKSIQIWPEDAHLLIRCLLRHGGEKQIQWIDEKTGRNLLHVFFHEANSYEGRKDWNHPEQPRLIMEELLWAGVDLHHPDHSGQTPVQYAAQMGFTQLTKLLRDYEGAFAHPNSLREKKS